MSGIQSKTATDFIALKAFSDSDCLMQARRDNAQTKKNIPLDTIEQTESCAVPSPEAAYFEAFKEAEWRQKRDSIARKVLLKLTETQRRRYLMRYAKKLSTRQIAKMERVSHVAVVYSLGQAEIKIKKFLGKC